MQYLALISAALWNLGKPISKLQHEQNRVSRHSQVLKSSHGKTTQIVFSRFPRLHKFLPVSMARRSGVSGAKISRAGPSYFSNLGGALAKLQALNKSFPGVEHKKNALTITQMITNARLQLPAHHEGLGRPSGSHGFPMLFSFSILTPPRFTLWCQFVSRRPSTLQPMIQWFRTCI